MGRLPGPGKGQLPSSGMESALAPAPEPWGDGRAPCAPTAGAEPQEVGGAPAKRVGLRGALEPGSLRLIFLEPHPERSCAWAGSVVLSLTDFQRQ